jgi:serralysin
MADRIGTNGNDNLLGTDDNDFFDAKAGNDQLTGGKGGDFLDGGDGIDTAHYEASAQGVTVRLFSGVGLGGDAQGDRFVSIENVIGSNQADTLFGSEVDNLLRGRGGADQLNGGDGSDTADYATSKQAVGVSLLESLGLGGDATGDLYTSIENITGSAFGDELEGDGAINVLSGGKGGDTLFGGGDADRLKGGEGKDILTGGAGADRMTGGAGADTFRYSATGDSGDFFGPNDVITDFTRAQGDKIDLHFIDANTSVGGNQDFTFVNGAFTAEGQVRTSFLLSDPAKTIVKLNTDSDPFSEMEIELNFVSVSVADFVL